LQPRSRRSQWTKRTRNRAIAYAPIVGTRDALRARMSKHTITEIDLQHLNRVTGGITLWPSKPTSAPAPGGTAPSPDPKTKPPVKPNPSPFPFPIPDPFDPKGKPPGFV
jgi:hypothetical protein